MAKATVATEAKVVTFEGGAATIKRASLAVGDVARIKTPDGGYREAKVVGLSKSGYPIFAGAPFIVGKRWKRGAVMLSVSGFMADKRAEKTENPEKPISASAQEIDEEFPTIFPLVETYDTRESTIENAARDGKEITPHKAGDPLPDGQAKSIEFFNGLRTSKRNKSLAMRVIKASGLGRAADNVNDLVDTEAL